MALRNMSEVKERFHGMLGGMISRTDAIPLVPFSLAIRRGIDLKEGSAVPQTPILKQSPEMLSVL